MEHVHTTQCCVQSFNVKAAYFGVIEEGTPKRLEIGLFEWVKVDEIAGIFSRGTLPPPPALHFQGDCITNPTCSGFPLLL